MHYLLSKEHAMTWKLSRYRTGDVVEVRSKEEILATLDKHGFMDRMPFIPEMLQYCGRRFRVGAVAHKTCDTVRQTGGRRLQATVHLDGLRCDGLAHGGCQAECNLFWKDEWLKPAADNGCSSARSAAVMNAPAVECTEAQLLANTHLSSGAEGEEPRYSCQATEMYEATQPLAWWDVRQYVFDVVTGNHSAGRVLRVFFLASLRWALVQRDMRQYVFDIVPGNHSAGRILHVLVLASLRWVLVHVPGGYWFFKGFHDCMHQWLSGRASPSLHGQIQDGAPTPTVRLDLKPGEYVRIKTQKEIEQTIDKNGKNRGLWFDPEEMAPYCGRVVKVYKSVSKIIDEPTGKMLHMKQPCIMLEGVVCKAEYASCRLNCPRVIPSYWREIWLERVEDEQRSHGAPNPLQDVAVHSGAAE